MTSLANCLLSDNHKGRLVYVTDKWANAGSRDGYYIVHPLRVGVILYGLNSLIVKLKRKEKYAKEKKTHLHIFIVLTHNKIYLNKKESSLSFGYFSFS